MKPQRSTREVASSFKSPRPFEIRVLYQGGLFNVIIKKKKRENELAAVISEGSRRHIALCFVQQWRQMWQP